MKIVSDKYCMIQREPYNVPPQLSFQRQHFEDFKTTIHSFQLKLRTTREHNFET